MSNDRAAISLPVVIIPLASVCLLCFAPVSSITRCLWGGDHTSLFPASGLLTATVTPSSRTAASSAPATWPVDMFNDHSVNCAELKPQTWEYSLIYVAILNIIRLWGIPITSHLEFNCAGGASPSLPRCTFDGQGVPHGCDEQSCAWLCSTHSQPI